VNKNPCVNRSVAGASNEALPEGWAALMRACDLGAAKALKRLSRALKRGNSEQAQVALEGLRSLYRIRDEALQFLSSGDTATLPKPAEGERVPLLAGNPGTVRVYCVSSMTLHECHRYLTRRGKSSAGEPEWMLAVTGLQIGPFLTLERWLEVGLSAQSSGHAAADMRDFTRLVVELDEFGFALHAILHSHRSPGPPRPSPVDLNLQETLEQAGYPAIQGVFSEDGYVRFFGYNQRFDVWVHGKGVETHGRFLFHLSEGCSVRNSRP